MKTFGQFALSTKTSARHSTNAERLCGCLGVTEIEIKDANPPELSALLWKFTFTMSDGREVTIGDYNGRGGWIRDVKIEVTGDSNAEDIIAMLRGAAGRIQDEYYRNNWSCEECDAE